MPPEHITDADRIARGTPVAGAMQPTPHRIEAPTVAAVDMNGHGYTLARLRDRDPESIQLTEPAQMHCPPRLGPGRVRRSMFCTA